MFEKLALYCNSYAELIPVSFVLGKELSGIQQGGEWGQHFCSLGQQSSAGRAAPSSVFVKLFKWDISLIVTAVSVPQHRGQAVAPDMLRESVAASFLEVFNATLGGALSNLV